ncbi:uncharacterized protein LOC128989656 [Macrosteles quadrilineatus]|uniref:uncharacterized protein LOC128989656 n=1 Tax=Macrosteles quadrilineatus TaxID=74068 RepID=UPI0023E30A22|nr:uncharacterized protein LOC128989656 [Macrosteles quadrilineatus]
MALRRQSTSLNHPDTLDRTSISLLVMICECPVCGNVAKPPMKMCFNGHVSCVACVLDTPSCSTCQERFSCIRPMVMEQIMRVVGGACRNARWGCLVFPDPSVRQDHEQVCGWRRVRCVWCCVSVGVNKWAEHVVDKHGAHALCYDTQGLEAIPLGLNEEKSLFYINGVMFCLYIMRRQDHGPLHLILQCFPTSKDDMDTIFEVQLENKGLYFRQSIHPISDAVKRSKVFESLDKGITIPHYFLKQKDYFYFKITMPIIFNNKKVLAAPKVEC